MDLKGFRVLVLPLLAPLALSRENISVVIVPDLLVVTSAGVAPGGRSVVEAFFLALCFLAWVRPILKTLKRRNHIYLFCVVV